MKTIEFTDRIKESISQSPSFESALIRLKNGKTETPRSWVYENVADPQAILDDWIAILTSNVDGDLKLISDWDLEKSSKYGYQGAVAPFEQRQHTLKEYWAHTDLPTVFSSSDWKRAKAAAVKKFGFNRTGKPQLVDAVIQRGMAEDKYNTSSGDPLCIKRYRPEAIQQAKSAVLTGTWNQFYPILGSRASMGKTGPDARWIFMFPMSVNLKEQTFQQPLQDYIRTKSIPFFAPWEGYEHVQAVLSSAPAATLKFGCDYSKMDQHFNIHHATECYDVIKEYFHPSYHKDLWKSIHYTFTCPVISCDGLIVAESHAMPSGSGWTNFLETVFNFILVQYFRIHYGLKILEISMGIGDDQLWFITFSGNVKKLTNLIVSVFKECGLDANPEKQEVSYEIASFLQRRSWSFWAPNGIEYAGVYPTVRALTSEVFPEFYHNEEAWDKKTFALRCLMILENCVRHPKFKEFCIYIAKGNSNVVEFCLSSDGEILLARQQAKKIANFLPTYNQEKQNIPITQFESLRIIREHFKKAS